MPAKSKSAEARQWKSDLPGDIAGCVRERAYQLSEQRGRVDGFALDD